MRHKAVYLGIIALSIYTLFYILAIGFNYPYNLASILSSLQINSTNLSTSLNANFQTPASMLCNIPYNFTASEILSHWNYKTYSKCNLDQHDTVIFSGDSITAKCANNETPEYFIPQNKAELFEVGMMRPQWKPKINLSQKPDFVMAKCGKRVRSFVFNHFSLQKSAAAKSRSHALSNNTRPLTVMLLVFDSLPRQNAMRHLPKTIKLLETLSSRNYSLHDFTRAQVVTFHTVNNMAPIIYGRTYESLMEEKKRKKGLIQELTIWEYFSHRGFVTLFLHDTVWGSLNTEVNKKINADHVFLRFWRVAYNVYGYHDHMQGQRCAGDQNSHYFALNYTAQFLKNYNTNNRFAYVHSNAAHESTGNIQTVDDDLADFLDETFKQFSNPHEDFALFLISDHGSSPNSLQFDLRAYLETRNPMTYVVLSKDLEDSLNCSDVLKQNSNKMISRFDIHMSLKELSHFPHGGMNESDYLNLKSKHSGMIALSLFREAIYNERSCEEIGVEDVSCTCKGFRYITLEEKKNEAIVNNMIGLFSSAVNNRYSLFTCEKVTHIDLISVQVFDIEYLVYGWSSLYKVAFIADGHNQVFITANFCTEEQILKTNNFLTGYNQPFVYFEIGKEKVFLQLVDLIVEGSCLSDSCLCRFT